MKDNFRMLVTFGFMAVLALIISLTIISLDQLQAINNSMGKVVEANHNKTAAANDMRDALRLRSEALESMRLVVDLFERGNAHQRFISQATTFHVAMDKLGGLGMNE